jgi:acylaminoacyl-peptidase
LDPKRSTLAPPWLVTMVPPARGAPWIERGNPLLFCLIFLLSLSKRLSSQAFVAVPSASATKDATLLSLRRPSLRSAALKMTGGDGALPTTTSPPKPSTIRKGRAIDDDDDGEEGDDNDKDDDASAYNEYASATVELSNAFVSGSSSIRVGSSTTVPPVLTVTRSVRDVDGNQRRQFLYVIPMSSSSKEDDATTYDEDAAGARAVPPMLPPQELPKNVAFRLPSPAGNKVAVLLNAPPSASGKGGGGGGGDAASTSQVLEIWTLRGQQLERRIRLDPKRHGKVIWDPKGFGTPSWNDQETAIVYPAERVPEKAAASHFDKPRFPSSSNMEAGAGSKVFGGEYTLGVGKHERWGEKYASQGPLVDLFCLNVETGNVGRIRNVPGGDVPTSKLGLAEAAEPSSLGGHSLGQPVWAPDGKSVVYVGWDAGGGGRMPRRLGLVYCCQRPKKLYASSVETLMTRLSSNHKDSDDSHIKDDHDYLPFLVLTPDLRIAMSPRFSPRREDGTFRLVFLAADTSFDTHFGCVGLHSITWPAQSDHTSIFSGSATRPDATIVVPQVSTPTVREGLADTVAGLAFPGIYELELPRSCFASPNHVLLTTCWGSTTKVVRISLDSGAVELIRVGPNDASSEELLCTASDGSAIVITKEPNQPGILCWIPSHFLTAPSVGASPAKVKSRVSFPPIAASQYSPIRSSASFDFTTDIQVLQNLPKIEGVDESLSVQSILLLPNPGRRDESKPPPLIVVPHGGPHSVSTTACLHSYAFLCGHGGYEILLVNYRGSTGFGQASIEALPTRIGKMDVADVVAATRQVIGAGIVDSERIGLCGGSHGGFLTAHCTSQHPELFKVAAMRNPVVNIATMVSTTDIPDWCYVEAVGSYDWTQYRPPNQQQLSAMWDASPVRHIESVKAPTLVALGLSDLRVPPSQGLEWYHSLRSMGVPTSLLTYPDDDHAIGGVASEADHWINIKRWFDRYL